MADQTSTLKVLITATNQSQAAFNQMNNSLNGLKTAALAVGTALATALSFHNVIDATRKWGSEVDQLQDQLGGTAEQMSALNFIAQSVGLTTDELSQTFGILNKRIADSIPEIAKGTSEFDKWNIKLLDAHGNIVGFDEAMRRIKHRFQEVGQNAQGTALLLDIFGRSGKQLSDFLALTDDEMRAMMQDAQNFGLIIDGNASGAIQSFNRQLYRLQLQFEGLKVQLGLFLIPLLSALIATVSKALGFIKSLGEAIGRMLGPFKEWIDRLGGVKAIADALLTIGVALVGLAALGGLVALIGWLGALALKALPVLSIATGLGLIAIAFKDIIDTWNGGGDTWDKILQTVGDIGVAFIGLGLILLPFNATAAIVVTAIGLVAIAISETGKTIKEVTDNWDIFVKALKEGKLNDIPVFGFFFEKVQTVLGWIQSIRDAWEDLGRILGGQPPFQRTPVGPTGPVGPPGVQQPVNPYVPITVTLPVIPPSTGSGGGGGGNRRMAQGGIVTSRLDNVTLGERGPEAVIPLSRGGGGVGTTIVNVSVAGSVLSENELVDLFNDKILRRLFAQRNLSF